MSSQSLFRVSSVVLLLGCALVGIGSIGAIVVGGAGDASPTVVLMGWLAFIGVVLLNLGLPGLYARFAGRIGVLGIIGYTLVQLFFLLEIVDYFVAAVIRPYLATHLSTKDHPPVGLFIAIFLVAPLLCMIGDIVFGIAVLRLGSQFRLPGIILIVAGLTLLATAVLPLPDNGGSAFDIAVLLNLIAFVWLNFSGASAEVTMPVRQAAPARG